MLKQVEFYSKNLHKFIPQLSVDCVVLGFDKQGLKVLLSRFKFSDYWMVPGGFVHQEEDVDAAAHRILDTRTTISNIYLKQFHLFGGLNSRSEVLTDELLKVLGSDDPNREWLAKRFITLGYYALVKYDKTLIKVKDVEVLEWFDIQNLPKLHVGHEEIIQTAIKTIRNDVGYVPIGYELLPEKFTMPELRTIYEGILNRNLDRRNFQRKMLSTGLIIPLNETRKDGAYKSPNLYKFNREKYNTALEKGIQLMSIIL